VPDIHRVNAGGALLQETIGESTSGSTDIDRSLAVDVQMKVPERVFQLLAPSAHVLFACDYGKHIRLLD
jgi:hypothetical protein